MAAGQKTLHFESRFRHQNGSYRWLSWTAVPDQERIYGMARDVTGLKEAEHKLEEAGRQLAQVTRRTTLATMTASIAHEINQPLGAIVLTGNACSRLLASAEPDLEAIRAALKRIVDDGRRASDILANIRSMLRHDRQQRLRLDVNDVVRDVLELVRGELERHRIAVEVECAGDMPTIVGEQVPLQQVVLNLVMNAVEEMASLTARPRRLFVETKPTGSDGVLVTVTDNGSGIEPSALERIFDAFFTTKAHGMGMGLSICRSIVEAHGGRLWAAPAIPHGSTFNVLLPLHDDTNTTTEEAEGKTSLAAGLELLHHLDEFGHGAGFQFAHDLTAVQLDRHEAHPQLVGDLLIEKSRHHQLQDLSFAGRERRVLLVQRGQFRPSRA